MLNNTKKLVVYLDTATLEYMFLSYSERRNYPVMNKLFSVLNEGFENNVLCTPLSLDHLQPYIEKNQIDRKFLNMMGELGQVQFHQRFTVKMLQLIRVVNYFFEQMYKKDIWKDGFTSDPDERFVPGFNKYRAITAQNTIKALEREKKLSQLYFFIEKFKSGKKADSLAADHYKFFWEKFPDLIKPYLPLDGTPEENMKRFFEYEDIREIPEFHIVSTILYPLFETYGIEDIEYGMKDDILMDAETAACYMPYSHYYVTVSDIAEQFIENGVSDIYDVKVYDNSEKSLYKLIEDISKGVANIKASETKNEGKTQFRYGQSKNLY